MRRLALSIILGIGFILVLPLSSFAASQSSNTQANFLLNGWIQFNSNWYYYENGTVKKGWLQDNGNWYYLDKNYGYMKTGWLQDNRNWYYLDKNYGYMKTGWLQDNRNWYYLDKNYGYMKTGWQIINGRWYNLNSNTGSLIQLEGWSEINGKWVYYIPGDYGLATNESKLIDVNGNPVNCHFDANGYWFSFNANVTAYSAEEGTGNANDGTVITGDPGQKMLAVDPALIPLHTTLFIPGYGTAVARDTGRDIKGNRIDVLFSTTAEANYWGRRNLIVEIKY
ncbi:3D domain-containing protein [Bacillus sp. CGMCC 1.60114]|uniref:3D domain-containing protein n=1 Tax=unclassified Bacillus (in: firmicutes) TaxID=185979 RepID=UPI003642744D